MRPASAGLRDGGSSQTPAIGLYRMTLRVNPDLDFLTILRRQFPIFIAAFFLALLSLVAGMLLLLELYRPSAGDHGVYMMLANVVISLYLCASNLLIVRGRPRAVRWVAVAMAVSALTVLVHSGQAARMPVMYAMGLILPLGTLLVLYSRRYCAMLSTMAALRARRIAWRERHTRRR